jgi:cobalt/nickel transport system permease protein
MTSRLPLSSDHWHPPRPSPVHRWPAEWKLLGTAILLLGTALQPGLNLAWFAPVWAGLIAVACLGKIPLTFILRRVLWLSPLIAGVALAAAWRPSNHPGWQILTIKSVTSLCAVILMANTTPFPHVLRVLKRLRTPHLLVTTIALLHRYLFVLASETERMQRARAARTFQPRPDRLWQLQASVIARLFIRASERATRIYQAMLARGWS